MRIVRWDRTDADSRCLVGTGAIRCARPTGPAAPQVSDRTADPSAGDRTRPAGNPGDNRPCQTIQHCCASASESAGCCRSQKAIQGRGKTEVLRQTEAAFEKFEQASQLDPRSVEYITAREFARQQLVMEALERGNKAMQAKNEVAATAEFRQALEYDPTNEFARQRLNDSVWESSAPPSRNVQVVAEVGRGLRCRQVPNAKISSSAATLEP